VTTAVVIAGGTGRMGQTLLDAVAAHPELTLAAVTLGPGESIPSPAPIDPSLHTQQVDEALKSADVLIDFTSPQAIAAHAAACRATATAWVLGTTGLDAAQQQLVEASAREIPICQAANFSTGVTLMLQLVATAAAAMDLDTDLEVIEAHHRHKVDAPSGTALAVGRAMAEARGASLDELATMSREGITGERPAGSIGFATVRGGDIVGDHTALFAADGERLEITHRASSRQAFARGACRAARWLADRSAGLYDMQDVLGLREKEGI
jgi:4-hydroxy-tetrahydrodipicolinate reductase